MNSVILKISSNSFHLFQAFGNKSVQAKTVHPYYSTCTVHLQAVETHQYVGLGTSIGRSP